MIDPEKLSRNVLRDLLESIGGPEDEALDKVRQMTPERAWITWCEYNGLIGLSEMLREAMLSIYSAEDSFLPEKRVTTTTSARLMGMRSVG